VSQREQTPEAPATPPSLWSRLYRGETRLNIVGHRRRWLTLSAVLLLVCLVSLGIRGLNLGIEFEGGVVWEIPAGEASVADARSAVAPFGLDDATIQTVESERGTELRIASPPTDVETSDEVTAALVELTGADPNDVNLTEVGPSWGREISENAAQALVVFLGLVTVYIALRFHLKEALPALLALVHDVAITVGVYSLFQFPVTPATVIAFLTILGYSLYDTIVVFDKVDENTELVTVKGNLTYGAMVNLSLNQTLMRSLNTTITALLPVTAMLIIGAWGMGAVTLRDFALALFIGLIAGAYSSFFVAAPLLAWLKEREPQYRDVRRRIESRGGDTLAVPTGATAAAAAAGPAAPSAPAAGRTGNGGRAPVTSGGPVIPARPRKKTRKARR
jgi:preprotein translocase subunit SecF